MATEVGEAKLVLDEDMLIPYEGSFDIEYPEKLAKKLRFLSENRVKLGDASGIDDIAERHFSYDLLAQKLHQVLAKYIG